MESRAGPCSFDAAAGVGVTHCESGGDRVDPHRPRDVFQVLLAEIDEIRSILPRTCS